MVLTLMRFAAMHRTPFVKDWGEYTLSDRLCQAQICDFCILFAKTTKTALAMGGIPCIILTNQNDGGRKRMKKLPYRAVITDLDRTLLRTDKSISGYTLEVLKKWRDAGAFLYAATARPERAITEYRELAGFRSATTLNGARTVTPGAVFENTIDPADAAFILEQLVRTEGMLISVETGNGIYASADIPAWTPVVTDDIAALPDHA